MYRKSTGRFDAWTFEKFQIFLENNLCFLAESKLFSRIISEFAVSGIFKCRKGHPGHSKGHPTSLYHFHLQ